MNVAEQIFLEDIKSVIQTNLPWNLLREKTILITGATGFIGSFIVEILMHLNKTSNMNIQVYAVGRNKRLADQLYQKYSLESCFNFIQHDICSSLELKNMNVNYIFHCASNASPDKYISDAVGTIQTNLIGTINLLDFAVKHNVEKFIYASTIEIYGKNISCEPIKENESGYINSMLLRSNYPLSKKTAENICVAYAYQYGLNIGIGRIPYSYGPNMSTTDTKVVAEFIRNAANGNDFVLKSKGLQKRSYSYLADIVYALFTILFKGENMEAYNISSSASVTTIVGLAEKLIELFPENNMQIRYDIPNNNDIKQFSFIEDSVMDSCKLESLGWKSIFSLDDGLKRSVLHERYRNEK